MFALPGVSHSAGIKSKARALRACRDLSAPYYGQATLRRVIRVARDHRPPLAVKYSVRGILRTGDARRAGETLGVRFATQSIRNDATARPSRREPHATVADIPRIECLPRGLCALGKRLPTGASHRTSTPPRSQAAPRRLIVSILACAPGHCPG
jgi:hypothetical protein